MRSRGQQGTATATDMDVYLDFRRDKTHGHTNMVWAPTARPVPP